MPEFLCKDREDHQQPGRTKCQNGKPGKQQKLEQFHLVDGRARIAQLVVEEQFGRIKGMRKNIVKGFQWSVAQRKVVQKPSVTARGRERRHPPTHHGDEVDQGGECRPKPPISLRALETAIQGPAQADKNHPQAHVFFPQPDENKPDSGLNPLIVPECQEHPGQQTGGHHIGVIIKSQCVVYAVECIKAQLSESCHPWIGGLYVPPNGHARHQHGKPLDKKKGPRSKDPGQGADQGQIQVKVRSQMWLMKGQQHIAVCQAKLTVFKEGMGVKAKVEGVGP